MSLDTIARSTSKLTRTQRIIQVLDQLRIERAHFAASGITEDWEALVLKHADRIASLTLVFPAPADIAKLHPLASRLLIVYGDQQPGGESMARAVSLLTSAQHVTLAGFSNLSWDDPVAKCFNVIAPRLLDFMETVQPGATMLKSDSVLAQAGEIAGVSYHLQGSGPALVLLPLSLAPSQWEKLLPTLRERYCTILLGGPELGALPILEHRGRSEGFRRLLRNMVHELQLQPGETILDIGCGSGVVDRWLAGYTAGNNPIVAVDFNPYFLREAASLARKEGLDSIIQLREGNAVSLPFEDSSFDVVFSATVMEEVDADRMFAEMIRVTKPAGRIGVIVRATDMPRPTSVQVGPELKGKCEAPRGIQSKLGCASADLYRRFYQSGLSNICVLPDWIVFRELHGVYEEFMQRGMMADLAPQEVAEWRAAAERAAQDGTFFMTLPLHSAVGTKSV